MWRAITLENWKPMLLVLVKFHFSGPPPKCLQSVSFENLSSDGSKEWGPFLRMFTSLCNCERLMVTSTNFALSHGKY